MRYGIFCIVKASIAFRVQIGRNVFHRMHTVYEHNQLNGLVDLISSTKSIIPHMIMWYFNKTNGVGRFRRCVRVMCICV